MKSKLLLTSVAIVAALSLLATACGDDGDDSQSAPEGDLQLGYILPQTGNLSFISDPMIKAVEMAAQEINDAGIQTINLIPGDSGTNADVANSTADSHLAAGADAIVGAASSGISLSIIDKITDQGIPMVSPSNTSPEFTDYDDGGLYFRTAPTDALQGRVMGDAITDDGASSVIILYRNDSYGVGLANAAEATLEDNGVTVVEKVALDPELTTATAEVQRVAASGADTAILIAFDEGGLVISQMIEAGVGPDVVTLFIPDGMATETLWELVDPEDPSAVAGIRGTRPTASETAEATFSDRFEAFAPDVDELFSSHSYDAVVILALAALVAGSNDPADFASEINGVTRGGTKCSLYAECAELVQDGVDIDYDGASGPLDFVDAGEPGTGTYDVIEYDSDGAIQELRTLTVS